MELREVKDLISGALKGWASVPVLPRLQKVRAARALLPTIPEEHRAWAEAEIKQVEYHCGAAYRR